MPQPPATRHRTVNSGHTYILSDPFSHSWYSHLQRLYIFNLSAEDLVGYCNLQLSWIISLSLSLQLLSSQGFFSASLLWWSANNLKSKLPRSWLCLLLDRCVLGYVCRSSLFLLVSSSYLVLVYGKKNLSDITITSSSISQCTDPIVQCRSSLCTIGTWDKCKPVYMGTMEFHKTCTVQLLCRSMASQRRNRSL